MLKTMLVLRLPELITAAEAAVNPLLFKKYVDVVLADAIFDLGPNKGKCQVRPGLGKYFTDFERHVMYEVHTDIHEGMVTLLTPWWETIKQHELSIESVDPTTGEFFIGIKYNEIPTYDGIYNQVIENIGTILKMSKTGKLDIFSKKWKKSQESITATTDKAKPKVKINRTGIIKGSEIQAVIDLQAEAGLSTPLKE